MITLRRHSINNSTHFVTTFPEAKLVIRWVWPPTNKWLFIPTPAEVSPSLLSSISYVRHCHWVLVSQGTNQCKSCCDPAASSLLPVPITRPAACPDGNIIMDDCIFHGEDGIIEPRRDSNDATMHKNCCGFTDKERL